MKDFIKTVSVVMGMFILAALASGFMKALFAILGGK